MGLSVQAIEEFLRCERDVSGTLLIDGGRARLVELQVLGPFFFLLFFWGGGDDGLCREVLWSGRGMGQ